MLLGPGACVIGTIALVAGLVGTHRTPRRTGNFWWYSLLVPWGMLLIIIGASTLNPSAY